MLGHLPLIAAVAAMSAAMVSLVDHAHESRTPAATAWVMCGGAAVVLCATMLLAATLQAWDRGLYRPLARICAVVARGVPGRHSPPAGAARPQPRTRPPAQHPLGIRRRAPPSQCSRPAHPVAP
jgi:hypothetical protein